MPDQYAQWATRLSSSSIQLTLQMYTAEGLSRDSTSVDAQDVTAYDPPMPFHHGSGQNDLAYIVGLQNEKFQHLNGTLVKLNDDSEIPGEDHPDLDPRSTFDKDDERLLYRRFWVYVPPDHTHSKPYRIRVKCLNLIYKNDHTNWERPLAWYQPVLN